MGRQPRLELGAVGVGPNDPGVDVLDRATRIGQRIGLRSRSSVRRGRAAAGRGAAEQVQAELQAALRIPLRRLRPGGRDARGRQAVDERSELELAEPLRHGTAVVSTGARLVQTQVDGQVGHDPTNLAAHERRFAVLGESITELALHLVEVLVDAVQRAELLEQADRRLLPDPRDARDVVRGVALQCLVVEHLVRTEAVSVHHLRLVVDHGRGDAHACGEQAHVIVDQLQAVQVARDDHRVDALGGGLLRERADHVVGLVALELSDRHAHHRGDLAHDRELGAQIVRHRRAAGLVLGVGVEPELGLADVEAHDRVVRLHVLHAAQHDLEEAEHRVDQRSVGHRERRQCEVAAVHEARPVDEHEERSAVGHRCP
jgi:hypothetical protein